MTPKKCARHELRRGEYADSPRYTKALSDSLTCWRCRALAVWATVVFYATGGDP
jgi:hypothetical protein